MSKHTHFDEAKIVAANVEFRAVLSERLEMPNFEGADARFKYEVMPQFYLAFAREMNRGTEAEDVMHGIASLMTHVVLSVAASFTRPGSSAEEKAEVCDFLTMQYAGFVAHVLGQPENVLKSVAAEPSGTA